MVLTLQDVRAVESIGILYCSMLSSQYSGVSYRFAFYLRSNFFSLLLTIAVSVYTLVIIIPYLAVIVRRLHDTNRSGGRIFVATMPIAGPIWLFIMLLEPRMEGENRYGIDPKTLSIEDEI